MARDITTRAQLIDALRVASELEHGIMAQYLFALYSLKRYQYEGLEPVQLERVRRWSSSIALIARQEMEHLGLALNLLSAIGGTPSFTRPNMPQEKSYYGQAAGIKLTLTRGDLETMKRFQHFEAPNTLLEKLDKDGNIDQTRAESWCHGETGADAAPRVMGAPVLDWTWNSVQTLYEAIRDGFAYLVAEKGERNVFVGKPSLQIFGGPASPLYGSMNDLNQYGLDLIAVTNLASATRAVTMILEQGEGVPDNPAYAKWTHFCLFTKIRQEMEEHRLGDIAARPVVPNPMLMEHPDMHGKPTIITNENTRQVAELFNGSYELMLLLLLYLYSDNVKTQDEVSGLMDAAFFPLMTMFVRPLAEILTELPAFENGEPGNAGPGFELNGDVLLFPTLPATWDLFQERINVLVDGFDKLVPEGKPDPWIDLPGQREKPGDDRSRIWKRLEYLRDCMRRLSLDWAAKWQNIGVTG